MKFEVILAGFGGQGILFAGNLLAQAGMEAGLQVTFLPVYGPEMRGGTCNCTVVLSDREIASPVVTRPKALLIMNRPSFEKFVPCLVRGGLAVVNRSLIPEECAVEFPGRRFLFVPADDLAEEEGHPGLGNMAALGALVAASGVVPPEKVLSGLKGLLPPERKHLFEPNRKVFRRGYEFVERNSSTAVRR
ncbi:2-oxoacid:acceptor oxidoreductase family protein [Thermosulfurimonas dismutans]|uniref:2-oxoglutarate oxidoreductase, gamma subunit n=1 Tax=Thermosulfurimonas dismutans TaxID=999894 RepID=A0A179D6Z0_9BACT|nr:2-oxoacid:acceptor oxidoreductase family protein [Thermosulfurimonas dismutans]OAQ21743.1 2-oxoglutarate oxidoreductase, gamma subunit [Thermosulfurimonas dismutans]